MRVQVVGKIGVPLRYGPATFGSAQGEFSVEQLLTWMPINREDFVEFSVCLREIESNPEIPFIVLPRDLNFQIPDFYTYTNELDRMMFTRFQVCYWLMHDENFTKPIHIAEIGSLSELRLLAGLGPQMHSVTVKVPDEGDYENLWILEMYYSAGDTSAAIGLAEFLGCQW